MFTGIIQSVGEVTSITPSEKGAEFWIDVNQLSEKLSLGDSISINGVCSTVVEKKETLIRIDYLEETLKKTTFSNTKTGDPVNLECSLTPNTYISGHFVTGHVDCTGILKQKQQNGPWTIVTIEFPKSFTPFLISKGSISLHGISLTVVDIESTTFTCHIIPHTLSETILGTLSEGDAVNLEFDQVGKYLYKFFVLNQTDPNLLVDNLKRNEEKHD